MLPYIVECKTAGVFKPIATFNVLDDAATYAESCAETNPQFSYQLKDHGKVIATLKGDVSLVVAV